MIKIPKRIYFLLPILLLLLVYFVYENNSPGFIASVRRASPAHTSVTNLNTTNGIVASIIEPTVIPTTTTPRPSLASTPTANPCGLGQATPENPDPSVRVESISPTNGKVGDIITIKGSGFGKSSFYFPDPQDFKGGVLFYGASCGYNSGGAPPAEQGAGWWSDDTVKVRVPGVSPGSFNIEVMSSDGKKSNRVNFQVTE